MITNSEHKEIYDILEKSGAEDKVYLRKSIIKLLERKERVTVGKILKAAENY